MDINSDLGESYGAWRMGDDAAMLDIVTSANVACGFHAGDPAGILHTLRAAAARGGSRRRPRRRCRAAACAPRRAFPCRGRWQGGGRNGRR